MYIVSILNKAHLKFLGISRWEAKPVIYGPRWNGGTRPCVGICGKLASDRSTLYFVFQWEIGPNNFCFHVASVIAIEVADGIKKQSTKGVQFLINMRTKNWCNQRDYLMKTIDKKNGKDENTHGHLLDCAVLASLTYQSAKKYVMKGGKCLPLSDNKGGFMRD